MEETDVAEGDLVKLMWKIYGLPYNNGKRECVMLEDVVAEAIEQY